MKRGGVKSTVQMVVRAKNTSLLLLDSTKYTRAFRFSSVGKTQADKYIDRVEADGGTVHDKDAVRREMGTAYNDGWLGICVAWFAGFAGYRNTASGVDKWYNMGGIDPFPQTPEFAFDAVQTNTSYRPTFYPAMTVLGSQPGLRFDISTDQGKHLRITNIYKMFKNTTNGAAVCVVHYAESDGTYAVIGTTSNDQWWTLGGTYMGTFRGARLSSVGTAAPTTGSQYTTIISNSANYKVYRNGTLDINTTADYSVGATDYYISDTTGRDDRALKGYIPEVIFFRDPIDNVTGLRESIENGFKRKYGL